jgi:hypothetical protein
MRERAKVILFGVLIGGSSTFGVGIFCFFSGGAPSLQFLLRFPLGAELDIDAAAFTFVTM